MTDKRLENVEATQIEPQYDEITESFEAMALESNLLRGVYAYGFETPYAVQQRAITPMMKGHDVIAQAQSKTGKTAVFSISILQRVDPDLKACQALVLAPSRELVQEIHNAINDIGDFMDIQSYACKGPASLKEHTEALKDGPQVVIGTPGRIQNMVERGVLSTDKIKMFVLDDADEMLARGFDEQIQDIFSLLSHSTQVILVSAAIPEDVLATITKFNRNFVRIIIKAEPVLAGIKQFYIAAENEDLKLDLLSHVYETTGTFKIITFCSTRKRLEWLTDKLAARGLPVAAMHGDMDAVQRCEIMEGFRNGSSRILLATDLLARGIDVQQVPLVINFDLPSHPDKYMYRVGWGGRSGRKGVAINLVTPTDMSMLSEIEQCYNTQIEIMPESEAGKLEAVILKAS
ncbi:translation initiation factor eIF4A [Fusarium equiseti]|uniref:RNA helicase n=1 Tax=Fusarium equiseti TaxID=61235 RepID=A0ABQ8QWD5_FUSEQ|nr:translation initiation factor eIF4A [Fusarium equiseti]